MGCRKTQASSREARLVEECLTWLILFRDFEEFLVVQSSHVKGQQTINRGELHSVEWFTRNTWTNFPDKTMNIYTDFSFNVDIIQSLSNPAEGRTACKLAHAYLVQPLEKFWDATDTRLSRLSRIEHMKTHEVQQPLYHTGKYTRQWNSQNYQHKGHSIYLFYFLKCATRNMSEHIANQHRAVACRSHFPAHP